MTAHPETKYEVERKYRLVDVAGVIDQVRRLGGEFAPAKEQVDTYYAHPARDFTKTDEALRIRRMGEEAFITYKGPKIDAASKTRVEIELPLCGLAGAGDHARLLEALGFRPVTEVPKRRRHASIVWQSRQFDIALDEIESLGTFLELETAADQARLDVAKAALANLADKLGLHQDERRSYLELLLHAQADGPL